MCEKAYGRPVASSSPAAAERDQKAPADNSSGSDMSLIGVTRCKKRSGVNETASSPESKRQQTEASDNESTVIGDTTVADMEDLDEGGFKIVRHRKDRTVGITVLIVSIQDGYNLRHVNPITLYSDIESMLGAAPMRSRFTAQGALLLNVEQKNMPTYSSTEDHLQLLHCKTISNIPVSARVPNAYLKNTCTTRGVPS
ncbi:hypothetical protein MTO96_037701 [Rhipicephalus appendiculatus]